MPISKALDLPRPSLQQPINLPTPLTDPTTPVTVEPSRAPAPLTYAQKAATPAPAKAPTVATKTPATKAPTTRPDTQLFVQVSPDYNSCKAGPFAILTALKTLLG